jgi:tyrosinase
MLFLTLLTLAGLTLSPVLAVFYPGQTYDYGNSASLGLEKRQYIQKDRQDALVEAIPYNGSIPLRLEIRDLQKNHEQWTLYILALSWMQWMNQTDPSSWYAIAGKKLHLTATGPRLANVRISC